MIALRFPPLHVREPVNTFTHLGGGIAAGMGMAYLALLTWHDPAVFFTAVVYSLSLTLMYFASTTFHMTVAPERTLLWLRRIDHATIYLVIAGSYTPLFYQVLEGNWRVVMLALIWGIAIIGMGYKLVIMETDGWPSVICYLLTGCLGLLVLPMALPRLEPGCLLLIALGAAPLAIGAVIFGAKKPNPHPLFGHHEIWHVCVLLGTGLHFIAIALYLV
jgi:hemolysin III